MILALLRGELASGALVSLQSSPETGGVTEKITQQEKHERS